MPDDPGRETLAMLARVLADPGNVTESDVLSLVAFAQAAAECANEAEAAVVAMRAELDKARAEFRSIGDGFDAYVRAASGRVRAALAETDDDLRIERWSQQVPIKPCFLCQTPKRIDSECNATPGCIEAHRVERERHREWLANPAAPLEAQS